MWFKKIELMGFQWETIVEKDAVYAAFAVAHPGSGLGLVWPSLSVADVPEHTRRLGVITVTQLNSQSK